MNDRTRTYEWNDSTISAAAAPTLDGLTFLQRLVTGELPAPPITATLGFTFAAAEPDRVVFTVEPDESHFNPIGVMHGGVFATLCDSACACAVQTRLPAGTIYTSLDLSVKYLRSARLDTGLLTCVGTLTHLGRRTALAEARVTDAAGRLYATATSTCLVIALASTG